MEFLTRPVAPYLVPVDGFEPAAGEVELLGEVAAEQIATAGPRGGPHRARGHRLPAAAGRRGCRRPGGSRLAGPGRRGDGAERGGPGRGGPALAGALGDPHADVRKAAVQALRGHPGTDDVLASAAHDTDADVRAYARLP
jgi:HEAT repeat